MEPLIKFAHHFPVKLSLVKNKHRVLKLIRKSWLIQNVVSNYIRVCFKNTDDLPPKLNEFILEAPYIVIELLESTDHFRSVVEHKERSAFASITSWVALLIFCQVKIRHWCAATERIINLFGEFVVFWAFMTEITVESGETFSAELF